MSDTDLAAGRVRDGDRRSLARLISALETGDPIGEAVVTSLIDSSDAPARRVGITGPPGAGKSTLVNAIVAALDSEGLAHDVLGDLDSANVLLARTASRRVLGFMNETAVHIDYALDRYGSVLDVDVITLNRQLQRSLHSRGRDYARPIELVTERVRDSAP